MAEKPKANNGLTFVIFVVAVAFLYTGWKQDIWGLRTPPKQEYHVPVSGSIVLKGKYIARCRSNGRILERTVELKPDNRFIFWESENSSTGVSGTYEVSGNEIVFTYKGGSVDGLVTRAVLTRTSGLMNESLEGLLKTSGYSAQESCNLMTCFVTHDDIMGRAVGGKGIHYVYQVFPKTTR